MDTKMQKTKPSAEQLLYLEQSFNAIRDISLGGYFSNKNVGFITTDMKNDKTTQDNPHTT